MSKRKGEYKCSNSNLTDLSVDELLLVMHQSNDDIQSAIGNSLKQIAPLVDAIVNCLKNGGRLFYIGAGTSGRLGVLDASELPPTFGVDSNLVVAIIAGGDVALRNAVENAEDDIDMAWRQLESYQIKPVDMVIGITASGSTPFVVSGLQKAQENGILTGCITCAVNSKVSKFSDYSVEIITGSEIIDGSTRLKAGTAQKIVLNLISTSVMIKMGLVEGNKMVNMKLSNQKLIKRGAKILVDEFHWSFSKAKSQLLKLGSVAKVLWAERNKRG